MSFWFLLLLGLGEIFLLLLLLTPSLFPFRRQKVCAKLWLVGGKSRRKGAEMDKKGGKKEAEKPSCSHFNSLPVKYERAN